MLRLLRALLAGPVNRRVSSIACFALALAQVLSVVHEGGVAHAVCAEHGEAIHTHSGSAPWSTVSRDGVAVTRTAKASPVSVGDRHEHCVCMSQRRERFALAPVIGLVQHLPLSSRAALHAPATVLTAGLDPVLVAPKGSPPV